MSVDTDADKAIAKLRNAIEDGIEASAEIVIQECCGYDEFGQEFRAQIRDALNTLLDLRERLR